MRIFCCGGFCCFMKRIIGLENDIFKKIALFKSDTKILYVLFHMIVRDIICIKEVYTTRFPFLSAMPISISLPALNSMASLSIPSENTTPLTAILETMRKVSTFPSFP